MTRKHQAALALLAGAIVWAGLLSLLTGLGGGSASVPADDGSRAVIKFVDKGKFYDKNSGQITLRLDITDPQSQPIIGLGQQRVRVLEEGIEVPVIEFNGPGTQAINVILVVDISGSMSEGDKMSGAQQAALVALDELVVGRDRIGIIAFDDRFDVIQPLGDLTDSAKENCRLRIQALRPRGQTVIGAPTLEALRLFEQQSPRGPKLLMVMTDGEDGSLIRSVDSIAQRSDTLGVPVYTIAFGQGNGAAAAVLQEIARKCNAQYFHAPNAQQLAEIYRSRVQEAADEFLIVYNSPYPEADGLSRDVEVQIDAPAGNLTARSHYEIGPMISGARRTAPVVPGESGQTTSAVGSAAFRFFLFLALLGTLTAGLAASLFRTAWRGAADGFDARGFATVATSFLKGAASSVAGVAKKQTGMATDSPEPPAPASPTRLASFGPLAPTTPVAAPPATSPPSSSPASRPSSPPVPPRPALPQRTEIQQTSAPTAVGNPATSTSVPRPPLPPTVPPPVPVTTQMATTETSASGPPSGKRKLPPPPPPMPGQQQTIRPFSPPPPAKQT